MEPKNQEQRPPPVDKTDQQETPQPEKVADQRKIRGRPLRDFKLGYVGIRRSPGLPLDG